MIYCTEEREEKQEKDERGKKKKGTHVAREEKRVRNVEWKK